MSESQASFRVPSTSFRNLAMWQKAQDLTARIMDLVDELPNKRSVNVIVTQLVDSASSIGANIAEGHGRFSAGAYRNHLSIARGSGNETIGWLDVLRRSGYVSPETENALVALCDEVLSMVSAQMIRLDKQTGKNGAFRDGEGTYDAT